MLVCLLKAEALDLQTATVRDIKEVIRTPLPRLIGFLARLESQTWAAESEAVRYRIESLGLGLKGAKTKTREPESTAPAGIQLSNEQQAAAAEILKDGVLEKFQSDDLRVKDLGIQGSLTDYL